MDRFIESSVIQKVNRLKPLKSNMDRFIAAERNKADSIPHL